MTDRRNAGSELALSVKTIQGSRNAELNRDEHEENGRGGWIRTNAWQDQNLLPYRLATPLYLLRCCLPSLQAL